MLLLALLSCRGPDSGAEFPDFELRVSETIGTVATMRFKTPLQSEASVEFGPTLEFRADSEAGFEHEVVLWGLPGTTVVPYRVVVDGDTLREGRFTTGSVPTSLQIFSSSALDSPSDGFVVGSFISFPCEAVVFDEAGDVVWWHVDDSEDFIITRARLSLDGQAIVYGRYDPDPADGDHRQQIVRVSLDGEHIDIVDAPGMHHDFVELPEGGYAWISLDVRQPPDAPNPMKGDAIRVRKSDGSMRDLWSVWDDFDWSEDDEVQNGVGWSHANALDYLPDDEAFLLSIRNFDSIVRVDRRSGELDWVFGGDDSDWRILGRHTRQQHQFHLVDDALVIFDNGEPDVAQSRAVEFRLDEEAMIAEQVWAYTSERDVYSFGLGSVHRKADGNTVVTFSTAGQMDEVDENGELVWRLEASLGTGLGYTTWLETLYPSEEELYAR